MIGRDLKRERAGHEERKKGKKGREKWEREKRGRSESGRKGQTDIHTAVTVINNISLLAFITAAHQW